MTKPKPAHLLQKCGRKPRPPEERKAWTVLEIRERCFVTLRDCWEWRDKQGRSPTSRAGSENPVVSHRGVPILVRRLAWALTRNCEVPKGKVVVPSCGNQRCMNPWHNRPMTSFEKQRLAAARGVFSTPLRRMVAALAKRASTKTGMTMEKARLIRTLEGPAEKLCREFNISSRMFARIRRNEAWRETFD